MTPRPTFVDDTLMRLGGVDFHCAFPFGDVPPGRLAVMKPRELVERYVELCAGLQPNRVVELGINRGGSTALLNELAGPEILVAVELAGTPVTLLAEYIERRGLGERVRPHYGVDQADRQRVAAIVDDATAGELLDLVVDDASHLYTPSRASFETLFPRLRPGGLYVIEDWSWHHRFSDGMAAILDEETPAAEQVREGIGQRIMDEEAGRVTSEPPLSQLAVELLQVRARAIDIVAEITVDGFWVSVRRGTAPLDPATFRLSDCYIDHYGQIDRR